MRRYWLSHLLLILHFVLALSSEGYRPRSSFRPSKQRRREHYSRTVSENQMSSLRQRKTPQPAAAAAAMDVTRGGDDAAPSAADSKTNSKGTLTRLRETVFPIHGKEEVTKFLLMGSMKFFIILALTLTRDTKDTLVVTQCGAEAIAFLKVRIQVHSLCANSSNVHLSCTKEKSLTQNNHLYDRFMVCYQPQLPLSLSIPKWHPSWTSRLSSFRHAFHSLYFLFFTISSFIPMQNSCTLLSRLCRRY